MRLNITSFVKKVIHTFVHSNIFTLIPKLKKTFLKFCFFIIHAIDMPKKHFDDDLCEPNINLLVYFSFKYLEYET